MRYKDINGATALAVGDDAVWVCGSAIYRITPATNQRERIAARGPCTTTVVTTTKLWFDDTVNSGNVLSIDIADVEAREAP